MDAFFNEIHGIYRSGAKVRVVVCDAAVHEDFEYKGRQPLQVGGGGGTAFDPVFEWMRRPGALRFDACIYLTDGYGPAPDTKPPCRVLWVVTEKNGMGDHLKFGRAIHLDVG
jgi:predicted metal-dependent peptidase